jgi:hypothetical protein
VEEMKLKCSSRDGVACCPTHILCPPTVGSWTTISWELTTPPWPPETRAFIAPAQSAVKGAPKGRKTTTSPFVTAAPPMETLAE